MNPSACKTPDNPTPPDHRPLFCLVLVVVILTMRWIWIAGLGDYGWTYELGMRTLQGEFPFRDYICTLPPLTSYTIVPFLVLLKGNLWAFSLHLYGWWIATLLVGLQVARALGLRPAAQSAAMFLAACLSLPATHLGHAYSYAGTFFFGLTLLELIKRRRQANPWRLLLAGAFAGLGVFAKQNIGVVSGILGLSVIVYDGLMNNQPGLLLRNACLFSGGMTAAFLPVLGFFASRAGVGEVFQQMFSDAGEGKGGLFEMLFHILPLFFFTPETPLRQLWTLVFSGGLALLFLGLVGRKLGQLQNHPASATTGPSPRDCWALIGYAIGSVALLSTISLLDLPQVRSVFNKLHPAAIYELHGFVAPLVFIAYAFFTVLAVICLLSPDLWRKPEFFLPIIALSLILWGHELSCQGYLPFGAPVVVPLAIVLLETTGLLRNTVPAACIAGVILALGFAGSTQEGFYPPSFKAMERLPDDTKYAHLWARPDVNRAVRELQENITPRIRDRTTLWICVGGPHLAWGGKPVYSVAALFADTYNRRSEPTMMNHWQAQPPEFVFVSQPTPCQGSQLLTQEALAVWLPQKYDPVWKSSWRDASLWKLRVPANNLPR